MKLQALWGKIKQGWQFLTVSTQKFAHDHLSAYAAQSTFYLMLSFFPFVMLVCMATRLLPISENTLLTAAKLLLPPNYQEIGVGLIDGYYNENIKSTKFFLILFLIWTASRLIHALMNGFNSAYGIIENRSQTVLRLIGCVYTIALCALMIALIVMYALGSRIVAYISTHFADQYLMELLMSLGRNLASPLLMLVVFWLSYVILPSRKARFRDELPGAFVTTLFWRGAVALMTVFLSRSMEQYSYVYGSLTSLIMLLVWLYTCVYVWFVGAELNVFLRQKREKKKEAKSSAPNS